jgi:hypothetical protein
MITSKLMLHLQEQQLSGDFNVPEQLHKTGNPRKEHSDIRISASSSSSLGRKFPFHKNNITVYNNITEP